MPATNKIRAPHQADPYMGYNFFVEWEGLIYAGFRECSGLAGTRNSQDYREGTDPPTMRKLGGMLTYPNITLRRGVTDNQDLWKWWQTNANGIALRRDISIVMLNHGGEEKIRWNLSHCWPITWTAPEFNATSEEVAIEALELVHEGFTVDKWS
ncbi:phage tail protein [Microcoleus sp. Pol11C2]|uniref:phage tail protein n=1 Tax=Microcoleus sp. Pol11C2 TaxID=3055389 RepID=UPI002FD76CC2